MGDQIAQKAADGGRIFPDAASFLAHLDEPEAAEKAASDDQRECQTCGYSPENHKKEAHLWNPYPFCLTCPDHEACATGWPCSVVKEVNGA